MKYLLALFISLTCMLSSCEQAPASSGTDMESQSNAGENPAPEPRDDSKPKAGPSKLTSDPSQKETKFRAFMEKYPLVELPLDFPWIAPELAKGWVSRPIAKAQLELVCGPGMIIKAADEQAFHAARFERAAGVHVLVTYLQGDFNERLVLTTHKSDGALIAMETIHSNAEDQTIGYSSLIEPSFKIYRSEMFYRQDERTGKQVPEVDHEDIFLIQEDGTIVQQ